MRRSPLTVLIVLIALFAGGAASAEWHAAQEASPARPQKGTSHADILARDLNLTSEQKDKVQAIYRERDRKFKSLYEEFRAQREAAKADAESKFQAVLTDAQKEKLKEVNKKNSSEKARALERKGLKTNS
jgi:Spy/CpxP family protein refolding chaperone